MEVGGCVRHASLLSISWKCLMEVDGRCSFLFSGCALNESSLVLMCIHSQTWRCRLWCYYSILTKQKTWKINLSGVDFQIFCLNAQCVCRCECGLVWAMSHPPYHCQDPGTSSVCLAEAVTTQQHVGGVSQQNKQHPHPVPHLTPCLFPLT